MARCCLTTFSVRLSASRCDYSCFPVRVFCRRWLALTEVGRQSLRSSHRVGHHTGFLGQHGVGDLKDGSVLLLIDDEASGMYGQALVCGVQYQLCLVGRLPTNWNLKFEALSTSVEE
ncbi:UNVERIFIED_CONTAM: hypothetical protein Slati_2496300 [Sesamum latifolium]|uniref:Uncharacterized protein n=1 Tax=Sesamum latifolium TaxID=2727402 RepID=A0AAW2WFH4_9LAMI